MSNPVETPKHKDLIFDVGMHKGEDTDFYLRKGFRVVAFEADPDLVRSCRNRFKTFIDQGRLVIVEGAILNRDAIDAGQKTVLFFKNDDNSVWGTTCANWEQRNRRLGTSSSTLEVDVVDFRRELQRHGMPYYMKIDIEGRDMDCVKELSAFRERPDYLSMESDKTSMARIKQEITALAELGYDSFQAVEQSDIPQTQSPPHPAREGGYVAQTFEEGSSGLFGKELTEGWKSKRAILRQYRIIRLGYCLVGDEGVMNRWTWRGSGRLRSLARRCLRLSTRAAVPGWYDTHARHSRVVAGKD